MNVVITHRSSDGEARAFCHGFHKFSRIEFKKSALIGEIRG